MNNSIKTILGIKDPYLKLDEKNFDNPIEDQPNQIIVHLIQTYPMHCPKCGHLMCKNGIIMTSLFDYIEIVEDGKIEFQFSQKVAPYVFELKQNFYSFKLSELANVRSKYALTLLKLWNANSFGKLNQATIKGSLMDWEMWFLGTDEDGKPKKWSAGRFKQRVLTISINELAKLYPKTSFVITTQKEGRKVTGYQLDITPINTMLDI